MCAKVKATRCRRRPRWKPSLTLNKIRRNAAVLRARIPELPPYFSARRLAKFLNFPEYAPRRQMTSKTPVLEWIHRGNLRMTRRGSRWLIARDQVIVLIDAACAAKHYLPPTRQSYLLFWQRRHLLKSLADKEYTVREFAAHFHCCPATVRRAIGERAILADHDHWRLEIPCDFARRSPIFSRGWHRRKFSHLSEIFLDTSEML